ncbi:MAG: ABA4-like family protein [Verrucomicrobiales bacterium]|jgi:hypothetical protein|nr:ABA4-like family protein [Verrucomicrobiales bacterium]
MTPETVFSIVNSIAFFSWVYLIAAARWTPALFRIVRFAVPILFALVYIAAMILAEPNEEGGFQTLAQVTALFTQPWVVVAGWLHYLAFDFFVGCWILEKAKREEIRHGWIVIPMILTFLFGPVGLLLFLVLLGVINKRRSAQTA